MPVDHNIIKEVNRTFTTHKLRYELPILDELKDYSLNEMNVLIAPSIVNSIINARILEEQEKAIENPARPDSAEDPDESFKKYTLINENYEIQVSRCVPRPNRDTSDT